ncbi:hypothetical protein RFI_11425 [Reticulomyxa filosa]|uniref:Uncharacterized protein n=1 Tax=Reticulomyxa filosa TaxID=46433 RepID=X6NIZ4_RETFI|nr:hypothetical protein RFI_11425 [Reticulomyxa filosa]|eukprot:ETO25714.1 hypothetical protein RFI_11425 [Reticulomyxa filosa]
MRQEQQQVSQKVSNVIPKAVHCEPNNNLIDGAAETVQVACKKKQNKTGHINLFFLLHDKKKITLSALLQLFFFLLQKVNWTTPYVSHPPRMSAIATHLTAKKASSELERANYKNHGTGFDKEKQGDSTLKPRKRRRSRGKTVNRRDKYRSDSESMTEDGSSICMSINVHTDESFSKNNTSTYNENENRSGKVAASAKTCGQHYIDKDTQWDSHEQTQKDIDLKINTRKRRKLIKKENSNEEMFTKSTNSDTKSLEQIDLFGNDMTYTKQKQNTVESDTEQKESEKNIQYDTRHWNNNKGKKKTRANPVDPEILDEALQGLYSFVYSVLFSIFFLTKMLTVVVLLLCIDYLKEKLGVGIISEDRHNEWKAMVHVTLFL